jgi:hypothetical protein
MRKTLVAAAAAVLVTGVAWTALADTVGGTTPVNCMDTLWRTSEASTTSTAFITVSGLTDAPTSIFPIAVDVSAEVSGAPVQFRVLSTNIGGQTHASQPGLTRFVPSAGGADSFSYRWVEPNQSAATHANSLRLQWRSPSGQPVHLLRADMTVEYATDACTGE